ncbi:MAG: hypothetical protein F6K28_56895, partial [Microcoleus sp. SIO2G3]|nr:hypothetical protein [Microcoleus sp. SIO2G3]
MPHRRAANRGFDRSFPKDRSSGGLSFVVLIQPKTMASVDRINSEIAQLEQATQAIAQEFRSAYT